MTPVYTLNLLYENLIWQQRYLLAVPNFKSIFINMESKVCPVCNKQIDAQAKFCPECGGSFAVQKAGGASTSRSRITPLQESLLVVGVVVLISAGYFLFSKPQPVPQPQGQLPAGHGDMDGMGGSMPSLPEDYDGLVAAGDQYMNQNNFPIAAECYKRALAIDDSSPDVRSDFASCLYGMGLADRALEEFRYVKDNFPLHGVSLFNLGVVFYSQKNSDSAKFYFAKYLELEPSGKAAEQARTYLNELGI